MHVDETHTHREREREVLNTPLLFVPSLPGLYFPSRLSTPAFLFPFFPALRFSVVSSSHHPLSSFVFAILYHLLYQSLMAGSDQSLTNYPRVMVPLLPPVYVCMYVCTGVPTCMVYIVNHV